MHRRLSFLHRHFLAAKQHKLCAHCNMVKGRSGCVTLKQQYVVRRLLSQLLLGSKVSGRPVRMLTSDTEFYSLTRQVPYCPKTCSVLCLRSACSFSAPVGKATPWPGSEAWP